MVEVPTRTPEKAPVDAAPGVERSTCEKVYMSEVILRYESQLDRRPKTSEFHWPYPILHSSTKSLASIVIAASGVDGAVKAEVGKIHVSWAFPSATGALAIRSAQPEGLVIHPTFASGLDPEAEERP